MTVKFEPNNPASGARIKVIGIGGGGGNAINNMIESRLMGVEFLAANTDMQALETSLADGRIQLGCNLTKGLGAGAEPQRGREAALEDSHKLREALKDSDMVFITAGLGGGTGTGGAPVIAEIAKELGALTVAVVTKPFSFEGKKRLMQSQEGIDNLKEVVDTLITIPNDRLIALAPKGATFKEMLKKADDVLYYAVKGISDLIMVPGLINLDFADVRTIMGEMGIALMGTGVGKGENRAMDAAQAAVSSPLLDDVSVEGARGLLVNMTSSSDLLMQEVQEASSFIQQAAHEDANIIWGAVFDENLEDEIRITVIATGIKDKPETKLKPVSRKETAESKELEVPTHVRMRKRLKTAVGQDSHHLESENDFQFDEGYYDEPTFLRKQAD
ncbi:MAG: cell division protein FtsZ [Deltaproteobacteria bacterium]|nr:cell division protein FtsZ [Deltaproteobacteria bacterium]